MKTKGLPKTLLGMEVDFVANGCGGRISQVRLADRQGLRPATSDEMAAMEEGAIEALELADPNWPCAAGCSGTLRLRFPDGSVDLVFDTHTANDTSNCKELTVAC